MFRHMKWRLFAVFLCTFIIAGCSNSSSNPFYHPNDDVYVMMKENDLYIKYPDKDPEKVASDVLKDSATYYDGKGLVFSDNNHNLYLYNEGEKQKIASDVLGESLNYKLSDNYKTIAYLTKELDLYAVFSGKDKVKVASEASYYYKVSQDGEYVYYINDDEELYYFSSDEQKKKIASDVDYFYTSDDGSKIVIFTNEEELYVRDLEKEEKIKVLSDEEIYFYVDINDNGDLVYLSDYDYDDDKGELYFKALNEESKWIASDVTYFQSQGDSVYYLDTDEKLYVKKIGSDKSKKLAEDVQEFHITGKKIYFVDSDDNLFSIKKGKKEEVGVDIAYGDYSYQLTPLDDDIVYLTKDHELYLNQEKVDTNVKLYSAYVDKIVYSTKDGDLCSVSTNKLDKKESFKDPDYYDSIFYSNQLVFNAALSTEDLLGVWEYEADDYSDGFVEIAQSGSSDESVDVTFYHEYEIDEEDSCEITDASETTVTLEDEILFTRVNSDEWKISYIDDPEDYYYELTKSTASKLADFKEENQSYYNDEYDF